MMMSRAMTVMAGLVLGVTAACQGKVTAEQCAERVQCATLEDNYRQMCAWTCVRLEQSGIPDQATTSDFCVATFTAAWGAGDVDPDTPGLRRACINIVERVR